MALKVDLNAGNISYQEFSILLKGGASLNLKSVKAKPYKWMLDVTWLNICELRKIEFFNEVFTQVSIISALVHGSKRSL